MYIRNYLSLTPFFSDTVFFDTVFFDNVFFEVAGQLDAGDVLDGGDYSHKVYERFRFAA